MLSSLIVVGVVYTYAAFPGNQLFSKLCVNYLSVCCTENDAVKLDYFECIIYRYIICLIYRCFKRLLICGEVAMTLRTFQLMF